MVQIKKGLREEINRSKAMANIATQIVNGAKITVEAMKLIKKEGGTMTEFPLIFGAKSIEGK